MKIGFIGAGNMGGALAKAAVAAGYGRDVILCDLDAAKAAAKAQELGASTGTMRDVACCDVVFLGVKPQHLSDTMAEFLRFVTGNPLLVSMAAGVTLEKLNKLTVGRFPIIRIMPNTPVGVGEGMIVYAPNPRVTKEQEEQFRAVLAQAGTVSLIDEAKIDAECAVAGCGPAFVAMFAEALADGGVLCGLSRDEAMLYARQVLMGTAKLLAESGQHPGALKDAVCSPGGSTIAGVRALEDGGFRATVIDAVTEAFRRTQELGK